MDVLSPSASCAGISVPACVAGRGKALANCGKWTPLLMPSCLAWKQNGISSRSSTTAPDWSLAPGFMSAKCYYDLLPRAFLQHGLPLALYVDYHSFFYTHNPDALTELGAALRFYGVSLQYASTPQAKGKIERLHYFWQNRLPALFGAEIIHEIEPANALLEDLCKHHNSEEIHRELDMTPQQAWDLARRAKRNTLRPCRPDPWWHYIWSRRSNIRVGDDGRVPIGGQRFAVTAPPRSRLIHCLHTNGSISILAKMPKKNEHPKVLLHIGPRLE